MRNLLLLFNLCVFFLFANRVVAERLVCSLDPLPPLRITCPVEGQEFNTEYITATFEISDEVPLDGSHELRVQLEFAVAWTDIGRPWYEYLPNWHGVETSFTIPIIETSISLPFKILESLSYFLNAEIVRVENDEQPEYVLDHSSVEFEVNFPDISEWSHEIRIITPCGTESSEPIEVGLNLPMTEDYAILAGAYIWGDKDNILHQTGPYETPSFIEEPGEYYCLYILKIEGYSVYTELCEYKIIDLTNIQNNQIENVCYMIDDILYIACEVGDKIELFTLEGIQLYNSIASNNLTTISGLTDEQLILVKVGNKIYKVIIQ